MIQNKSHNCPMSTSTAARPPFPLRMPDELRASLEDEAKKLGRSLNSEIVARLEQSLEESSGPAHSTQMADVLQSAIEQQKQLSAVHQIVLRRVGRIIESSCDA